MSPRAWRLEAGLTLKETAKRLGCSSASCVFRYENGERETPNSIAIAYERISKDEHGKSQVTAADLQRARKRFLRTEEEGGSVAA